MVNLCPCNGPRCRLTVDDERHGTYNSYFNYHCRCEPCREACAVYSRQRKDARIVRGIPEHVHGTPGGYGNWRCRCRPCTDAWTADITGRAKRARRGDTRCARGEQPKPKRRSHITKAERARPAAEEKP